MRDRLFVVALVAVCTAAPVAAQDRAMFILNSGERHNGMLVYGRGDNLVVDLRFHLATGQGELEFPFGDVAVIDIGGGSPSAAEIQSLPGGARGVMIMRSGHAIPGHLHNIVRGGLVQWVGDDGRRQNYPIDEVHRLYLNADHARATYLRGSAPVATAVAAGAGSGATIRVDGNQRWVDTGIDVRRGERVQFTASGQVGFAPGLNAPPNGLDRRTSLNYPVPLAGAGALIAKVGDGAAFAVGAARQRAMPAGGRLYLGVNDDDVSDNRGAFAVEVTKR